MKKFSRWAVVLGLCLALVVCGAMAAESGINVQLDGQNLAFTDAAPQVKDQRTFLPFRAVFEAMGAEVNNEGNTITAVRGDKTLTMTIGSTEATVTEKGVSIPITMDVAPYVDESVWRTYVPVRFAAQAFDCAVGWDQTAQTAVIIDTEKLVKDVMEGKSFTYLEKIAAMGEKYNEGIWNMDAAFGADISMFTLPLATMEGTVEGTMKDSAQMDMTMNMKMDMDALIAMVGSMGGEPLSAEDQAMLDAFKTDGIGMSIRGDIDTGKLYMNMDLSALGAAMADSGLDPDAWYELDMAALMEQAGIKWSDLMSMSENTDMLDVLASALATTQPNDAVNGYKDLKKSFDDLFAAFADDSFVLEDDLYTATYEPALNNETSAASYIVTLSMDGDKVTAYGIGVAVLQTQDDTSTIATVSTLMDDQGNMSADMEMDMGGMITINMVMDGNYTPGTTAPVVTPPAGAKVIPFTDLMGQTGDLGVIGGADGPTSIFVSNAA